MTPLIAAIVSRYQSSTAITATGPYVDAPKDDAAYPYGVISFVGEGKHKPWFDGTYEDESVVRFTMYDDNLADLATIQTNLHARFDKHKLSLSSGENYHTLRDGQSIRWTGVEKNGAKVYRADSTYRLKVIKSY